MQCYFWCLKIRGCFLFEKMYFTIWIWVVIHFSMLFFSFPIDGGLITEPKLEMKIMHISFEFFLKWNLHDDVFKYTLLKIFCSLFQNITFTYVGTSNPVLCRQNVSQLLNDQLCKDLNFRECFQKHTDVPENQQFTVSGFLIGCPQQNISIYIYFKYFIFSQNIFRGFCCIN